MNHHLARTAALVDARRRILGNRRRGFVPKQLPPSAVERAYRLALLRIVDLAWQATYELRQELPTLLHSAAAERRLDAGEGDRIKRGAARARERIGSVINQRDLEELARTFAARTATHQRIQLEKQTKAVLGADPGLDRNLAPLINGFVVENAQLITNVSEQVITDVALTSQRAITSGMTPGALAKELEKRHGFARDRARLIARDQIGKLTGQINVARQKAMGVSKFIWRTVKDDRVRGAPDGLYPKAEPSHYDREGKTYSFDDPPDGELPGEPIQCRCYAEPVFDDILDELDAFAANAPALPRRGRR